MCIKDLPCSGMIPTLGCIPQKLEKKFFLQFHNAEKDPPSTPKKSPCLSFLHSLRCPNNSVIKQPRKAGVLFYSFINLFLAALGLRCCTTLVAVSRGYSLLGCSDFSLQWLLLFQSTDSKAQKFQ